MKEVFVISKDEEVKMIKQSLVLIEHHLRVIATEKLRVAVTIGQLYDRRKSLQALLKGHEDVTRKST